ncbi:RNA-binding protein 34 [Bulinus truncatus]|nr:RNA-binding protein 34 [Bulinus truncatus]
MANNYKPGMVAGLLFANNKKNKEKDLVLANLFSKPQTVVSSTKAILVSSSQNKSKKKNQSATNSSTLKTNNEQNTVLSTESFPFIHETLLPKSKIVEGKKSLKRKLEKKDVTEEFEAKRPRRNRKRVKHSDNRTLFIGNCPLSADKKTLKKLFQEFGEIETVRFRCAPPADPHLPRRAIVITKNFHEECNNMVAYVVFKEEDAAQKALVRNGHLLDGLHIRVDIAALSKKHDKKRSVFVGNLPFNVTEEAIRSHFEDCGDIINVRLIRDRLTSLGKGICYVQFESKDSVSLAVKLNNSEFKGRKLRVMVCSNKQKKKELKESKKSMQKENDDKKPKVNKVMFGPSNKTKESFKAALKAKKEKRFRKLKKKKDNANKTDGLSSIFGSIAPVVKKTKGKKVNGDKVQKGHSQKKIKKFQGGKRLNKLKS